MSQAVEAYAQFSFDTDEGYQQGLVNVLANLESNPNVTPDTREEVLLKTRVFYFNRLTSHSLTIDEAKTIEHSRVLAQSQVTAASSLPPHEAGVALPSSAESTLQDQGAADTRDTRVLTLAELQYLIQTNQVDQIPNNKKIPDALNSAPPSESKSVAPKKPWE
ncbi:hypothetical protein AX16_008366 [Volvariella volvacea WC 439]|nr:hypothetical protein AX16_008366 [Volvariella volvacea WC 439]